MKNYLLTTLILLWCAAGLQAQVTTSSITGSVKDARGEALIGATVKATHQPSGTVYGASTNTEGRFNIGNTRIGGPYLIEVSYIGFQNQTYSNINLNLGTPYQLAATLSESGTNLQEVVITGAQSDVFNANRTGAATNIGTQQINTLPTITRSLTDFTRLTPQANGNGFAGRNNRYNNLQVDGANFNNAFGTSNNPLPGGNSQPISLDAIEEVQVNIAPYDVRQSGFTGAGINAVTRSGTNTFTGSAYTFYRNQNFAGTRVGDEELPAQTDRTSNTYGARFGGPIIKNKLFFFANFEHENETYPGITWVASRPGLTGSNVARTTAIDLERVRQHLISTYDYDPGGYENYANDFNNKNTKFLTRFDWNISDKHKFTIRYNQVVGTSNQTISDNSAPNPRSTSARISANSITFENSNYSFKNVVRSLTGELNSNLTSRLSNQLLATYSRIQDTRSSKSDIFPFVDIWQGGDQYMSFGYEPFSYDNDVINNNYNFINNLTYQAGNHTFTGGVSFEVQNFGNSFQRYATSYYRYASVDDFINNARPSQFGLTYPYEGQDPYSRINFGLGSLYVQDRTAITNRLDLTFGVRAELPIYMNELTPNPSIDNLVLLNPDGEQTSYSSGEWPKARVMLSPRIGFNYDVLGNGSFKLRGGTGIFAGRVPFVWLTNMPTGSGVIQNTLEGVPAAALNVIRFNPDRFHWLENGPENVFIKEPNAGAPGSFALVDRDFRMPQVWRSSLGIDYTIPGTPLVASADLLYTKDIRGVYQFNTNRKPATMQMNYSGDDRAFWNGSANARYSSVISGDAIILSNTNKGYSASITGGLSLPSQKGLFGSIYYTYTQSEDITGNTNSSAASSWSNNYSINDPNELSMGYSQYAVPHRVVGSLSYRLEYINHLATTVSLFYEGSNPGRFAYTYNGDINRDGVSNDLLYIPQSASEINFAPIMSGTNVLFTPQQQREAFENFVSSQKDLEESRGGYVTRNSGLLPWYNRFDVRLLQDIFTNIGSHRNTLQFSVDMTNLGNLLSSNWGIRQQLNTGSSTNYGLLVVPSGTAGVSAEGVPTFNMITVRDNANNLVLPTSPFRNTFSLSSTWSMQLGLRYIF